MKITVRELKKVLENALLNDGPMEQLLFEYEFEDMMGELLETLITDKDDYLFALTTHKNDVTGHEDTAILLLEPNGEVHVNEVARDKLKEIWEGSYVKNMKQLIPDFAKQLHAGDIPINGIKAV
jgi:hypothetical protein